jgi:hypothetical protein
MGVILHLSKIMKNRQPIAAIQKVTFEICKAQIAIGSKELASIKKNLGRKAVSLHIKPLPFLFE